MHNLIRSTLTAPAARFWTARMGEEMDDVFLLSRIQFALTIMFHYIFPPLSIGLGAIMVIMEGTYLRTGNVIYHQMTRFWSRVFAVNFAMGVATGIVMEFQFGTNWAAFSRYVGDVFGSALAAEGIFAFFLESGFLGVLVFGWDRVSQGMHFFATVMAAMEGHFETGPAALNLVGIPDGKEGKVKDGIGIPGGLSFLVHGDFSKPLPGLNDFPEKDRPPVMVPFVSYHLMVGIGGLLMALSLLGLFLLWRGTLFTRRWLMALFVGAVLAPIVCNQAGWVAAEVGRQPFIVYPKQTVG